MSKEKDNQSEHSLRLSPLSSQQKVMISFNGEEVEARLGEKLSTALLAAGYHTVRLSRNGSPHGFFCGMGICYECLVKVDQQTSVRACQTFIRPGMLVETEDL